MKQILRTTFLSEPQCPGYMTSFFFFFPQINQSINQSISPPGCLECRSSQALIWKSLCLTMERYYFASWRMCSSQLVHQSIFGGVALCVWWQRKTSDLHLHVSFLSSWWKTTGKGNPWLGIIATFIMARGNLPKQIQSAPTGTNCLWPVTFKQVPLGRWFISILLKHTCTEPSWAE